MNKYINTCINEQMHKAQAYIPIHAHTYPYMPICTDICPYMSIHTDTEVYSHEYYHRVLYGTIYIPLHYIALQ